MHYTPIIKGQMYDLRALNSLPPDAWKIIRPVVEMTQPEPPKTLVQTADLLCTRLASIQAGAPIALDLLPIPPKAVGVGNEPLFITLYERLRAAGLKIAPVVGFDREDVLWNWAGELARDYGNGLVIRLEQDEIENPAESLSETINRLVLCGLTLKDARLILDVRSLVGADEERLAQLVDELAIFLEEVISAGGAGEISIAGSSILPDVGAVPQKGYQAVDRNELDLWIRLLSHYDDLDLGFGDYGIVFPNFTKKPPAPHANGKIRYTRGKSHHIFRGYSLRKEAKYAQYRELASRVVKSPFYLGASYSPGDRYISDCVAEAVGTGSLGTWVEVDMNHHLTYTSRQVPVIAKQILDGTPITAVAFEV